ncbi:MAG: D-2-hydroxyacid dehydrogenase [Lachnospiraceae bacterium]|nr:D-2-hydroxyacid dehydrogenase [Lachnospiraceae bacterium]
MMKILVISTVIKDKQKETIMSAAAKAGAEVYFLQSENEITSDLQDAEIVYGFAVKLAKTSKKLKWLCVPSAGVDFLMRPDSFANEECLLTNSAGAYGVTIAEHIIAVSIMMMRNITDYYAASINGKWAVPKPQKSLKDCRITVLGTGDIGTSFARRAKAFEPESIVGVCRSGRCDEAAFDRVMKVEELDSILPETELLVMSLPATKETENILSRERMALLPSDAYIVNVGRGSAIDEDALAEFLDSGRLAGAALDVFRTEPLPEESRLWKTKNLLITPHVAGNLTLEHTLNRNVEMFCEDLINYAEGKEMRYLVDRKKGY